MGVIELNGIFRAKNKTAAQWASENPILRDGELGHEKDTHKSKVGDGVTAWNGLPYEGVSKLGTPEIISNFSVSDIMDAASDLAIGEMKVWHTYNDGTPIPDAPANYPLGGTLQRVETIPNGGEDSVIITAYGIGPSNKQLAFIRTVNDNEDTGWQSLGGGNGPLEPKTLTSDLWDLVPMEGFIQPFWINTRSSDIPNGVYGCGYGFVAYAQEYDCGIALAEIIDEDTGSIDLYAAKVYNDSSGTSWSKLSGSKSASALTDAVVITGAIKDFDFGFEKAGDMKPLKIARTAVGLPDTSFDFYGWAQCQYRESATQYNVSLYIIQTTTSKPRIFTAMYAKGYTPSWVELGKEPETGWLYEGDQALSNNVERSFYLRGYSKKTGDRLQIEFAYLGGGTEGHIMGFNQGQTIIYNPAETLTTSFWTLVTNSGNAQQYEVLCTFRMSGQYLYIKAVNQNSGSVNVAAQFRIKGVRVLRQ
jgi:tail fiber protein